MYTHILHIADIHLRTGNLDQSRKIEYEHVFQNLLESFDSTECIKNGTGIVTICGDVFHNKHKLESTTVQLWINFMKKLLKRAPVVVICGNHDFRQEDPNMPDLIDVMIQMFEEDTKNSSYPCYYLRETGIYPIENICFGVVSIKDTLKCYDTSGIVEDLPDFPIPIDENEYCKVALFHGTITASSLPNGQTMASGKGYPLEWFKGYDMVLLGDNHKQQVHYNQEYNFSWGYPGSIVQQDIGEPIYGHGYILWDIRTKIGTPVHVYNGYSRYRAKKCVVNDKEAVKVKIDSGVSKTLSDIATEWWFPKNPYVIIHGNKGDDTYIKDVLETYNITPSYVTTVLQVSKSHLVDDETETSIDKLISEIASINHPSKWIKYVHQVDPDLANKISDFDWINYPERMILPMIQDERIPEELQKKISEKRDKTNKLLEIYLALKNKTTSRNTSTIILKHISWSWAFSYGEQNWFNFENMEGNIGVINGPNASGKSSFIDTICIAIFGEPSKNRNLNSAKKITTHFLHHQRPPRTHMVTDIVLEVNGELYQIIRNYSPHENKNDDTMAQIRKCELWSLNKDTLNKNLLCSGAQLVDGWVKHNCGEIDDILRTTILSQFDHQSFFLMKPGDQKDLIDQALNLDSLKAFCELLNGCILSYHMFIESLQLLLASRETTKKEDIVFDKPIEEIIEEYTIIDNSFREQEKQKDLLLVQSQLALINPPTMEQVEIEIKLREIESSKEHKESESKLSELRSKLSSLQIQLASSDISKISDISTYANTPLETIENLLDNHNATKPINVLDQNEFIKTYHEVDTWWNTYHRYIEDPVIFQQTWKNSHLMKKELDYQYQEWMKIYIPKETHPDVQICGDNDTLIYYDGLKKIVAEFTTSDNIVKDLEDIISNIKAQIPLHEKSTSSEYANTYEEWQIKWNHWSNSSNEIEQNKDWISYEVCKKNRDFSDKCLKKWEQIVSEESNLDEMIRVYSSKKNTLENEYEEIDSEYTKIKNIETVIMSFGFKNIEDLNNLIQEVQSLQNQIDTTHITLTLKTKQINELTTPIWKKKWSKITKINNYLEENGWTDKYMVLDHIGLIKKNIDIYQTLQSTVQALQDELNIIIGWKCNISCDACIKSPSHTRKIIIEKLIKENMTKLNELGSFEQLHESMSELEKALEYIKYVENHEDIRAISYRIHQIETEISLLTDSCHELEKKKGALLKNQVTIENLMALKDEWSYMMKMNSGNKIEKKLHGVHNELDATNAQLEMYQANLTKIRRTKEKLGGSYETLCETHEYWSDGYDAWNIYNRYKNTIHDEKAYWEARQADVVMSLTSQLNETIEKLEYSRKERNRLCVIARDYWEKFAKKIEHTRTKLEKDISLYHAIREQYPIMKDKRDLMLKDKQLIDEYKCWTEKYNELNYALLTKKVAILEKDIALFEMSKLYESQIAWHKLNTVKKWLQQNEPRKAYLKGLIEYYKSNEIGKINHASTIEFYHTLLNKAITTCETLYAFQSKLMDKKSNETITFREWVYTHHVLPLLERQINYFLADIDTIRIKIDYHSQQKQMRFIIMDRGNETVYATSSGYQQFIIGLAMRQALANIGGAGNNLKHMFIDEGFTACDSVNVEKSYDMLKKLIEVGGFKSILIVSHLDSIKDAIPLKIHVGRDGVFSQLRFGSQNSYGKYIELQNVKNITTTVSKPRGRPRKS